MTDITLTRLAVRATDGPPRLHLRATTHDPDGIRGRLWFSVPLDKDPNFQCSQTFFDPDSAIEDVMYGCMATGVLRLRCGCSRQISSIGTDEAVDHLSLSVHTSSATGPDFLAACCPAHCDFDFGEVWSVKPDPWFSLAATLTLEELAAIRACISAHRDGIRPMALAGLCGAAGIRPAETHLAEDPQHVASVTALAVLRTGIEPLEQVNQQWFPVRATANQTDERAPPQTHPPASGRTGREGTAAGRRRETSAHTSAQCEAHHSSGPKPVPVRGRGRR